MKRKKIVKIVWIVISMMIIFTMLVGIFEVVFFSMFDAYQRNKIEIDNWVLKDGK